MTKKTLILIGAFAACVLVGCAQESYDQEPAPTNSKQFESAEAGSDASPSTTTTTTTEKPVEEGQ